MIKLSGLLICDLPDKSVGGIYGTICKISRVIRHFKELIVSWVPLPAPGTLHFTVLAVPGVLIPAPGTLHFTVLAVPGVPLPAPGTLHFIIWAVSGVLIPAPVKW